MKRAVLLLLTACASQSRPAARPDTETAAAPAPARAAVGRAGPGIPDLVFVLAGQSNMEGGAYVDGRQTPSDDVLAFKPTDLQWKPAVEPLHGAKAVPDLAGFGAGPPWTPSLERPKQLGLGPGVAFGKEMAQRTGKKIGLIPVAVSGASMDMWDPARHSDPSSLYGKMLATVRASGLPVAGVLWFQGEADALGGGGTAGAYAQKLEAFIAAVRRDFGSREIPFVYAQISRFVGADAVNAPFWNFVQEAQRKLGPRLARTAVVTSVDLPLDDPVHLGTEGAKRVGSRFAKAMARILGIPGAPDFGPTLSKIEWEETRRDRIRVTYARVNGALRPSGHVLGFSVAAADGSPGPAVFDASVDLNRRECVIVRLATAAPEGATLSYGRGLDPACDLRDAEDHGAPVFGPHPLDPPP